MAKQFLSLNKLHWNKFLMGFSAQAKTPVISNHIFNSVNNYYKLFVQNWNGCGSDRKMKNKKKKNIAEIKRQP